MSNSKGRASKSKKLHYAAYNYEANRARSLTRHLARQPNDTQAAKALKNIQYGGPRKSGSPMGWVQRNETVEGFTTGKKDDKGLLYENLSGPKDALDRALMAKHIRDVERRHQHEVEFNSKKNKKK